MSCKCSDCCLIRELEFELATLKQYIEFISSDIGYDAGVVLPDNIKKIVDGKTVYPETLHD